MNMTDETESSPDERISRPSGYLVLLRQDDAGASLDFGAILARVFRQWTVLACAALVGLAIAGVVAWKLPVTYTARVVLAPVSQGAGSVLGSTRSQLGGLAALAGIEIGGGNKEVEALAALSSHSLVREFITTQDLLPELFKEGWDPKSGNWRPREKVPTVQDAVDLFTSKVRTVSEDRRTGLITVLVTWTSPDLAAAWANGMVDMANERLREDSIRESDQSLKYLDKELQEANTIELQQVIYRLIEAQVNNKMLANVQRAFAFRVIDPAFPPKEATGPNRIALLPLGGLIGLLFAAGILFVKYSMSDPR